MTRSRQSDQWDHTAAIMALYINSNRGKHSRTVSPAELNPYRGKKTTQPKIKLNSKDSMKLLKRVFIDHAPPTLEEIQSGKI